MEAILKDALKLLEECKEGFGNDEPYRLLLRCIDEQTVEEGGGLRPLVFAA